MAPSVSKEELMRNSDHLVWGLAAGSNSSDSEPNRICERLWVFLNSRACNVIILLLVNIESLVIVLKLLITLEVIRDPDWKSPVINCTANSSNPLAIVDAVHSPKLKDASLACTYASTVILTFFLVEIIIRLITGKLRYITQGVEVFDAIIVIIVFSLGIAFLISPSKARSARDTALLLIFLRIWRFHRVFRSITDAAKVELNHVVHTYQREKTQAEHKVDILILKVEDLEHEVAYLKEKLKKTERESVIYKKRRSKEGSSWSQKYGVPTTCTATIAVETVANSWPSAGTQTGRSTETLCSPQRNAGERQNVLHIFADNLMIFIMKDVWQYMSFWKSQSQRFPDSSSSARRETEVSAAVDVHATADSVAVTIGEPPKSKVGTKLKRRPDGSLESGYGSAASSINWDRIRANNLKNEAATGTTTVPGGVSSPSTGSNRLAGPVASVAAVSPGGHLGLKCPESSPESGYGSTASAPVHARTSSASPVDTEGDVADMSSGSAKHADTVFLFPEPKTCCAQPPKVDPAGVELEWLDEQSEIERVMMIEFDPNRKDKGVPMTSL